MVVIILKLMGCLGVLIMMISNEKNKIDKNMYDSLQTEEGDENKYDWFRCMICKDQYATFGGNYRFCPYCGYEFKNPENPN